MRTKYISKLPNVYEYFNFFKCSGYTDVMHTQITKLYAFWWYEGNIYLSDIGYSIDIINEDNRLSNNIYLESTVPNNDIINGILNDIAPFNSNFQVKNNNSLAENMGKNGRKFIQKEYSLNASAENFLKIIKPYIKKNS